ncbi:MAG: M14 family zinc carboxypeptidase, partial [Anaerolineales bacterium]|nr:M14 family zinc carboxypeptidase [Anaerolineales bacterium]
MPSASFRLPAGSPFQRLAITCLIALALAVAVLAGGQASQGWSPGQAPPPPGEGPWVVVASYQERAQLDALASRLEPWEVDPQRKTLVVAVTRDDYLWMQELGFAIQVDEALTRQFITLAHLTPLGEEGIPNYACYRTVEETYASAADLAAAYPTLAAWLDIGDSWTRTAFPGSGYDLRVLRLTNSALPGPKPAVFVMSALHAREYAPAELNLRFAEYLLHSYNLDPDVTWLLDHHEFHLLLQANPDGR